MPFNNEYFKLALSVDNVIFAFHDEQLQVLLLKRSHEPYDDEWALPGAMIAHKEDLEVAAFRILKELTGFENVYLEQVKTFGGVNRYPLGRVITIAYFSLINYRAVDLFNDQGTNLIQWHKVNDLKTLPFDHLEILHTCVEKLRSQVRTQPIGFGLLPPKFTLTQLQKLYEAILAKPLDKRNFRKKILSLKVLTQLDEIEEKVAHRPARMYSFDEIKYQEAQSRGIIFEI